jgi:hypothetical protein
MAAWYVGVVRADGRGFRVRHVEYGEDETRITANLAAMWRLTFDRNTRAMATVLLSNEWIAVGRKFPSGPTGLIDTSRGALALEGVGLADVRSTTLPLDGDLEADPPGDTTAMYLLDAVGRARLFVYVAAPNWQQTAVWRLRDLDVPPTA